MSIIQPMLLDRLCEEADSVHSIQLSNRPLPRRILSLHILESKPEMASQNRLNHSSRIGNLVRAHPC
jgi:hypothetical protein